MDYKLAKKLKDAGFPQRRGCSACLTGYAFDFKKDPTPIDEQINSENKWIHCPTLSDLIEACGNGEFELHNNGLKIIKNDGSWYYEWKAEFTTYPSDNGREQTVCWGKTPEEAVAKLYLELREKSK